ncbi:hypothetical protein GDO86_001417 [Hymenochirus boettgeri]|uniref:Uncharacterized protein n=1 Tax=Hymenochirus boettgeri TaxID=247094 RepID=A0A8T2KH26_9PIPI|nr:hypothetical protein GDO86_001417 [Hymenochirus boettgeri]
MCCPHSLQMNHTHSLGCNAWSYPSSHCPQALNVWASGKSETVDHRNHLLLEYQSHPPHLRPQHSLGHHSPH